MVKISNKDINEVESSILIDSHCHLEALDLSTFDGKLENVIEHAKANDVGHILWICAALEMFPNIIKKAETFDCLSVAVAKHSIIKEGDEPTVDDIIEKAKHPKVIAVGETGLTYNKILDMSKIGMPNYEVCDIKAQRKRFINHIQAAKIVNKPLIIHNQEGAATKELLRILQAEKGNEVGGVFHFFIGDCVAAKKILDLGFYISFAGNVTFKEETEMHKVVKYVPSDRFLIETDAPYAAPEPYRGRSNYPGYVKQTAEHIAKIRDVSYQEIADITTNNFQNLFGKISTISN